MLIFTNRDLDTDTNRAAFGHGFKPANEQLEVAPVTPAGWGWKVTNAAISIAGDASSALLEQLFAGDKLVPLSGRQR